MQELCKFLLLKRPTGLFAGYFFLDHLAPPSKGKLMPKGSYSSINREVKIFDLEFMLLLLNLLAFIEAEASLLAPAKSIY